MDAKHVCPDKKHTPNIRFPGNTNADRVQGFWREPGSHQELWTLWKDRPLGPSRLAQTTHNSVHTFRSGLWPTPLVVARGSAPEATWWWPINPDVSASPQWFEFLVTDVACKCVYFYWVTFGCWSRQILIPPRTCEAKVSGRGRAVNRKWIQTNIQNQLLTSNLTHVSHFNYLLFLKYKIVEKKLKIVRFRMYNKVRP